MYIKENIDEEFPYRNFYLKLILIVVVVALIVCIINAISSKNKQEKISNNRNLSFSENLNIIKTKAIGYYTEDNIPKNIGESDKLTLEEMISKKIVLPIKDENKKLCNNKKSYIKLTKKETEYQLKINLSCDNEEDYIIVHLNNSSYCNTTYLCEIKSNEINKETDEASDSNEESEVVNKKNYQKISSNSSTNLKTKKIRKKQITPVKTGTIKITDTTDKYKYEYAKNTNYKLSTWSTWSTYKKGNCSMQEVKCNENDVNCLKEIKKQEKKEETKSYNKQYSTVKSSLKKTTELNAYVCANDSYIKIDGLIFKIDDTNDYSLIDSINSSTKKNIGGWVYNGEKSYSKPPIDTYNTRYILVGPDYSNCNNTCDNLLKYHYDKYTYMKKLTIVTSYTCDNNKNKIVPVYSRITDQLNFNRTENSYEIVCYKSERIRKILDKGYIVKKWSKYNDLNLLNDGYHYTGNKK